MLVIADTSPINYLVLIGHIDLLPRLFERVALPTVVQRELSDADAPADVRTWIANPPAWLEILPAPDPHPGSVVEGLDAGETAAILLSGRTKPGTSGDGNTWRARLGGNTRHGRFRGSNWGLGAHQLPSPGRGATRAFGEA